MLQHGLDFLLRGRWHYLYQLSQFSRQSHSDLYFLVVLEGLEQVEQLLLELRAESNVELRDYRYHKFLNAKLFLLRKSLKRIANRSLCSSDVDDVQDLLQGLERPLSHILLIVQAQDVYQ